MQSPSVSIARGTHEFIGDYLPTDCHENRDHGFPDDRLEGNTSRKVGDIRAGEPYDRVGNLISPFSHIQRLVDRFGPAQAHHMLMVMADTVAPRGGDKPPPIYISVGGKVVRAAN